MSGTKHDEGKAEVGLVPWEALEAIGNAFGFGARVKGYGVYNFTKGLTVMRNLNAAIRHIYKAIWVSRFDEESGLEHLGHAGACVSMAIWTLKNKPELNDTYTVSKETVLDTQTVASESDSSLERLSVADRDAFFRITGLENESLHVANTSIVAATGQPTWESGCGSYTLDTPSDTTRNTKVMLSSKPACSCKCEDKK